MATAEALIDAQTKYWRLRRIELLDCLSDADVKELVSLCQVRVVARGAVIYDAGENSDVESRIQDILFKDVRTRLAHTVARLANKFGEEAPEGQRIGLRLTQTDLAQLIGSTRETTSTIFNEFRRDGLLGSDGHYIIVRDLEALSAYQ